MKVNQQRRKFLMMGGWFSVSWWLSGCDGGGGSQQSINIPPLEATALPDIVSHPEGQTVTEGEIAIFGVMATGDSLTYQWQKNGVDIPGASDASYATPQVTLGQDGAVFSVVVANAAGSVISNQAILLVGRKSVSADSLVTTVDSLSITVDEI